MGPADIAEALRGRKSGCGWMARCPAHDDRAPSLSISSGTDGKLLVHCHAGCDQRDVIAALRIRGAWEDASRGVARVVRKAKRHPTVEPDSDAIKRTEAALAIWRTSQPAAGTAVGTYLRSRGLTLPVPLSIRFHAGLKHPSGGVWPAMVALVTRGADDKPIGIHRTFLARDGSGKAPVEATKMMFGPCRGGAVRLGQAKDIVMVGEGIETCLAAIQASGHAAWAALSTSGLRALDLPTEAGQIVIIADGDDAGEAAAQYAAERWTNQGRGVRIARPPRGMDFNDLLGVGS